MKPEIALNYRAGFALVKPKIPMTEQLAKINDFLWQVLGIVAHSVMIMVFLGIAFGIAYAVGSLFVP